MSLLSQNAALNSLYEQHIARLAEEEALAEERIRDSLEAGTMVLLGNPCHSNVRPILVGQPARVKVNDASLTRPLKAAPTP